MYIIVCTRSDALCDPMEIPCRDILGMPHTVGGQDTFILALTYIFQTLYFSFYTSGFVCDVL